MPEAFNDSGVIHGSQKVQISGHNYVLKNIRVGKGKSKRTPVTDEFGNETRQFWCDVIPTGTATAQLLDATSPSPPMYATLPLKPLGSSSAINYIIDDVGEMYGSGDETLVDIGFAKQMNGTTGS